MVLDIVLEIGKAGIALANHHLSVFATAHLYNALRHYKAIHFKWQILERIKDVHVRPIIAGSRLTTPQAMSSHLEVHAGLETNAKVFDRKKPYEMSVSPASTTLRALLDYHDRAFALHDLEAAVQQRVLSSSFAPSDTRASRRREQLSSPQSISQLAATFSSIVSDIRIPYMTFTKVYNKVMLALRARLNQEFKIE